MEPEVSLRDAPFLEPSRDELAAIVRRHVAGLVLDDVHRVPSTGIAHAVYALGDALILRVPKAHPDALLGVRAGAAAVPPAVAAGVATPRLVVFDETEDVVPVPFVIVERAPGETLDVRLGPYPQDDAAVWEALGQDLARLHARVTAIDDPHGSVRPRERRQDADAVLEDLRSRGLVGHEAGMWVETTLGRLRPAVPPPGTFRRFLHGDVYPGNILVDDGRYAALIDWDDAAWGDPALELAQLPTRALDATLAGYRSVTRPDGDDTVEQRILWDKLLGALARLSLPPRAPIDIQSPTPTGRLFDLFAAAADGDSPILRHLHR